DLIAEPYVRDVFTRIAEGASLRSVARWVASLPAEIRGGRQLYARQIRWMLESATYIGRVAPDDGDTSPGGLLSQPPARWPALADDATWRAARARVASHRSLPHQASGRYLLTGLLRCPRCGTRMGGVARPERGVRYYRCEAGASLGARTGRACQL